MKLFKEKFSEIKYSAIREFCKALRGTISDTKNDKWFCINCGSEQDTEECRICISIEYVIPLNEDTQKFTELDTMFENIKSVIRDEINDSIRKNSQ